ncbi:Hypothetical predicted protein [Octopus vulgaris]|uniref:Uncharacterized protein n=1 Tax=Octopus vulgaris TaxID=6645 RepID=A0AA36EYI9_OCTVU|nr:Hypothetical predicted protein [Octopus vulgaris]
MEFQDDAAIKGELYPPLKRKSRQLESRIRCLKRHRGHNPERVFKSRHRNKKQEKQSPLNAYANVIDIYRYSMYMHKRISVIAELRWLP